MSKNLSREQLLTGIAELPSEIVDLPELGGVVTVRGMSTKDSLAIQQAVTKPNNAGGVDLDQATLALQLVLGCVVDGDGKRLFKAEDAEALRAGRGDLFQKLASAAMRVNGLSADAGNLPAITSGDSSSD